MKTEPSETWVHPLGEEELDFKFLPAGGQFHLRGSDEALTAYGGLVAWDHFLELAYRRLQEWLSQTAPQLSLTMEKPPPWLLFLPPQADQAAVISTNLSPSSSFQLRILG